MDYVDLDRRLLQHVRAAGLFSEPGAAVLAVSGGPDSLAMLHLFCAIGSEIGLTVIVGHVDHGILPDSARVAEQVVEAGAQYQVAVHVERMALGSAASETTARRARYRALRRIQREVGARYLVTAHHADDQIETVLYRLLKGSGVSGLAGIPAVGPGGLVRPLLLFGKAELEAWLMTRFPNPASRPPVFHDPSNIDLRHDRAWIRTRVVPALRERLGQRLDRALLDLAAHAGRERDAWAALVASLPDLEFRRVEGGVDVSLQPLVQSPAPLAEALLMALARDAGCQLGPRRSARLLGFLRGAVSGRHVQLGQGFRAEVSFGRLRLWRAASRWPEPAQWGYQREGQLAWGGWTFRWGPEQAGVSQRSGWDIWVVPGGEGGLVRATLAGDRLLPLGGTGHRAVSRLLMEARVPRGLRHGYPVVVVGEDLVWVPGVCRAQAAVPAPGVPAVRLAAHWRAERVGAADVVG